MTVSCGFETCALLSAGVGYTGVMVLNVALEFLSLMIVSGDTSGTEPSLVLFCIRGAFRLRGVRNLPGSWPYLLCRAEHDLQVSFD